MQLLTSDLAQKFYAFMEGRNTPGTIGYYKRHIERFIVHVGDAPAERLKKIDLLTFGKTWHSLQAIQRLFTWAHADAELITRDPFKTIKRPRLGGRRRVLTEKEMARLLRRADLLFRPFLMTLRESIARPQEVRVLTWEALRWEDENQTLAEALASGKVYFELWEYKSRRQRSDPTVARVILVSPRLARYLLRLLDRGTQIRGIIFRNKFGSAFTSNAVRLRMRRLCNRIGILADNRGEKVVAYTFRHTAATAACAKGIQDRVLAELMGHTSTRTTSRYQHLCRQHLHDAMNRLKKHPKPR